MLNYEQEVLFENRFWLQVLGDHARFIFNALSPSETERIHKSIYFIKAFDELLSISRKPLDEKRMQDLNKKALDYAKEIRVFKLSLIKEHLVGDIAIELPPTFLNHMVNEVEEYIYVLNELIEGKIPAQHPLHYHEIWLPDAAGHAGAIQCGLDSTENELRKESKQFARIFDELFIKAFEYKGFLRTGLDAFPALTRFNLQVDEKIKFFMKFLTEIQKLRSKKMALGTISVLIANHMFREECYYLIKLSRVSEVSAPDCDPTAPRIT